MEKEISEKYEKAKSISDSLILFTKPLLKENTLAIHVAGKIEKKIKELGGGPAFPVNVSINENAAHYTPDINDFLRFKENDLVKIDIGVHVDGYIWDRAFTVCIGRKTHPLIEAAEQGLKEAMKAIQPGAKIFEISEIVESTLEQLGFNPIRNLCGHGLDRYNQHAHFSIPNGRNNIQDEIKPNQALAMEVFATDGAGWVKDSKPVLIFGYVQDRPVRLWEGRRILKAAKADFNKLPFAKRWLTELGPPISQLKIDMALKQLLDVGAIREYPLLKEESGGLVAQAEETIILK
jgi:methionyl aminopeptidase